MDECILCIGGSRGVCPAHAPSPKGSRFFRLDIQNFRNVTGLGVDPPPTRSTSPSTGNPGSTTALSFMLITQRTLGSSEAHRDSTITGLIHGSLFGLYWERERQSRNAIQCSGGFPYTPPLCLCGVDVGIHWFKASLSHRPWVQPAENSSTQPVLEMNDTGEIQIINFSYYRLCFSASHSDHRVHAHVCWNPIQLLSSEFAPFYEKKRKMEASQLRNKFMVQLWGMFPN